MERAIKITYRNKEYFLRMPYRVKIDIMEEYELKDIFDIFEIKGSLGMFAVLDLAKRLSAAGGNPIEFDRDMCEPEFLDIRFAVVQAVYLGIKRDVAPEEIDEGLLELEKKKAGRSRARTSWFWRVLGLVFPKRTRTTRPPE